MTESDIEIILERAKELHPEARPRIISDNGPQFIAEDFKEFIRISGMTHVGTSPYCMIRLWGHCTRSHISESNPRPNAAGQFNK